MISNHHRYLERVNLTPKTLKNIKRFASDYLKIILSHRIALSSVPHFWKVGKIPVYKAGDRRFVDNYHPIYLTNDPSNLIEHIMCSHISVHLNLTGFVCLRTNMGTKRDSPATRS